MLETLGTATSITGVGLLTTPTTTSLKSVETVKNEKTGEEEYDINAFKMGTAVAASINHNSCSDLPKFRISSCY